MDEKVGVWISTIKEKMESLENNLSYFIRQVHPDLSRPNQNKSSLDKNKIVLIKSLNKWKFNSLLIDKLRRKYKNIE